MGILQNGPVAFQPKEQGLSDALSLFNWYNRSMSSLDNSPASARGQLFAREFYGRQRKQDEQANELRNMEMNAIRQKMAGGGGAGAGRGSSAGLGPAPTKTARGGMSPHEQQQMQEQAAAKAAKAERQKQKQMREDERLHMNNLLNDYERYQSKGKAKSGGMGGSGKSGGGGDTGYTEQIFNNAGAPQVVKLNYQKPNESAAMEQDAILKIIMGAMR